MTEVTVREARAHLADLIQRAAAGEDIVLTRHGEPVAQLTGYRPQRLPSRKALRESLQAAGVPVMPSSVLSERDEARY